LAYRLFPPKEPVVLGRVADPDPFGWIWPERSVAIARCLSPHGYLPSVRKPVTCSVVPQIPQIKHLITSGSGSFKLAGFFGTWVFSKPAAKKVFVFSLPSLFRLFDYQMITYLPWNVTGSGLLCSAN